MMIEDPKLYDKLMTNVIKYSPKRTIGANDDDSDSSFNTKNNTIVKTRFSKKMSHAPGTNLNLK